MIQTLKPNKVTLADLETQFGLVATHTPQFFSEWTETVGELMAEETQALERVKANFDNLLKEPPLLEGLSRWSLCLRCWTWQDILSTPVSDQD